MRLRWVPPLSSVIGLTALLGCSTPISFEPQFGEDDELPDSGVPIDAGARDAAQDAARDAAPVPPLTADCDLYEARDCPREQPRNNTPCRQIPQPAEGPYCYYRAQATGQVQVAECRTNQQSGSPNPTNWRVEPARCSYRCTTDLPQTGNFFSLLTTGCGMRPPRDCRAALARTSQEGVDRQLRDFVVMCGLPASFQVGVTFNDQGCAEWLHYQAGPRLTTAQSLCLSNQLENVRFNCEVSCALTPSTAP